MSILTGILTAVLLFCNLGADSLLADTLERTFPAAAAVEVVADDASIVLIGGETGLIELKAESNKEIEEHYEISSGLDNGVLLINVERKNKGFGLFRIFRLFSGPSPSISLSLAVPFQTACRLRTSSGSIDARSLDADLAARTGVGSINCNNVRGEVTLKTGAGSIAVDGHSGSLGAEAGAGKTNPGGCSGAMRLKTGAGSITVDGHSGSLNAKTGAGKIKLSGCSGAVVLKTSAGSITVNGHSGSLDAKTSAGSIKAELVSPPIADCRLQTSSGGITLSLPEGSNADLYAKTSSGRVSTDIPVSIVVLGKQTRNKLAGKIGYGGPSITLKTSSGRIRIRKNEF